MSLKIWQNFLPRNIIRRNHFFKTVLFEVSLKDIFNKDSDVTDLGRLYRFALDFRKLRFEDRRTTEISNVKSADRGPKIFDYERFGRYKCSRQCRVTRGAVEGLEAGKRLEVVRGCTGLSEGGWVGRVCGRGRF